MRPVYAMVILLDLLELIETKHSGIRDEHAQDDCTYYYVPSDGDIHDLVQGEERHQGHGNSHEEGDDIRGQLAVG